MELDRLACDRARRSRDARFDGRFFIAVTTTGIYCRPICPARAPKDENVRYFPTAAAAEAASMLSINALREDLEVSHRAASHWLDVLERLYFLFRLRPYHSKKIHSIKKDRKLYLWDHSVVPGDDARIENLVACHLLKFCHFLEDTEGYRIELHFLRDRAKREVDFLVAVDRKPWFAVEVKKGKDKASSSLRYFAERLRIPHLYQVVWDQEESFTRDGVFVMSPTEFLSALR